MVRACARTPAASTLPFRSYSASVRSRAMAQCTTASSAEGNPLLEVDLAKQPKQERDLVRLVAFARAHDDRRHGVWLFERPVNDVVAPQSLNRGRHQANATLRRHQAERRL